MNIENNDNNQTNKHIIPVKIGNVSYNLSTNESDDYIKGIAKYINSKMDELSSIYSTLNKNSTSFLLVSALNIADDLFKQRQLFNKNNKLIEELENKLKDLKAQCNNKENSIKYLEDKVKDITKQKDNALSKLEELNSIIDDKNTIINDKDSIILKLENELNSKPDYDITSSLAEKDEAIAMLEKSLEEKDLIIDNLKDNLNETTMKLSNIPDIEELQLEKDIKILELEEEIEKLKSELENK